jgi:hypothetical protein
MIVLCTFDAVRVEVPNNVALNKMGFITMLFQDSDQPSSEVLLNHPNCSGEIVQHIVDYLLVSKEELAHDPPAVTNPILNLNEGKIIQVILAADFLDVQDLLETMAKSRKAVLLAVAEQSTNALRCLLERGANINNDEPVWYAYLYVANAFHAICRCPVSWPTGQLSRYTITTLPVPLV